MRRVQFILAFLLLTGCNPKTDKVELFAVEYLPRSFTADLPYHSGWPIPGAPSQDSCEYIECIVIDGEPHFYILHIDILVTEDTLDFDRSSTTALQKGDDLTHVLMWLYECGWSHRQHRNKDTPWEVLRSKNVFSYVSYTGRKEGNRYIVRSSVFPDQAPFPKLLASDNLCVKLESDYSPMLGGGTPAFETNELSIEIPETK